MKKETITLSEAEIEVIKAKREKEAADKKLEEAENKKMEARKIAEMKEKIVQFKEKSQRHEAAVADFFNAFEAKAPGKYNIVTNNASSTFEANNGYASKEKKVVYATEIVTVPDSKIVLMADPSYYITVKKHEVYHRSSFRATNNGLKMFITRAAGYDRVENRAYSSPKKVNEKIDERIAAVKNQIAASKKKASAQEQAIVKLTETYPNAEVKTGTYYSTHAVSYRRRSTTEIPVVKVTFPNGTTIKYTYRLNADNVLEIDRHSWDIGNVDKDALIDYVINMPLKEN